MSVRLPLDTVQAVPIYSNSSHELECNGRTPKWVRTKLSVSFGDSLVHAWTGLFFVATVWVMGEHHMKRPWDGYCQPGHAMGSHRLRLVARLVSDTCGPARAHYRALLESERACEVSGPRNEDPTPEPECD